MAGNARGARAFLGPLVCTSVVLRNLSDLVKVQAPWNSRLQSIIFMISIVGNARDPRAFPNTSWQNCARVARICDASVDHSPGAAPSVAHLPIENARDTRAFASTGWLKCTRVAGICKGLVHPDATIAFVQRLLQTRDAGARFQLLPHPNPLIACAR